MFLAALDGVPRELVEAARVDGATELRVWRHIVIPAIRPTIVFVLVLLVIGATQVFTQVYLMTGGGPYNSTQVLFTYAYQQAFTNFEFSYAAAIASLIAVVVSASASPRSGCCAAGTQEDTTCGDIAHVASRGLPSRAPRGTQAAAPSARALRHPQLAQDAAGPRRASSRSSRSSRCCSWSSLSFQPTSGHPRRHADAGAHRTRRRRTTSQAWTENSFGQFFLNSLYVSLGDGRASRSCFASLAAFAFARFRFPFREVIFYVFLASLAVPSVDADHPAVPADEPAAPDRLAAGPRAHLRERRTCRSRSSCCAASSRGSRREFEEAFRLEGAGTLRVLDPADRAAVGAGPGRRSRCSRSTPPGTSS